MLSDFAFVGVVMGSAMLAVGLLAQALPPNSDAIGNERRELMILLAAYAEGLGVLAAVVGLLVLFVGVTSAGGVTAALLVLVPVLALGIHAVRLAHAREREGVHAVTTIMVWFIGALAALASIVALMAVLIPEVDASGFDAVTLVATVIVAGRPSGSGSSGPAHYRSWVAPSSWRSCRYSTSPLPRRPISGGPGRRRCDRLRRRHPGGLPRGVTITAG